MKCSFGILFLFIALLVSPTSSALACGSHAADHEANYHQVKSKKSCCSKSDSEVVSPDGSKKQTSECPCDEDNGSCHCPGCGVVCHGGSSFAIDFFQSIAIDPLQNVSMRKRAFYFAQHMPEDVYRSIWQPPKIQA